MRTRSVASVSGYEKLLLFADRMGGSVILFEVSSEMLCIRFVVVFVLRGLMVTRHLDISRYEYSISLHSFEACLEEGPVSLFVSRQLISDDATGSIHRHT